MKTLVIVPIYNEAKNINSLEKELDNYMYLEGNKLYDVVYINDCSNDNSLQLLKNTQKIVIDLPINLGIGGAVQTGYKYAAKNNYDIAIQYDGDIQHDAQYIKEIIKRIENGSDYVIASRFINNEGFQSTVFRRIGIRYLSWLIKFLSGKKICDITSGFRGCNKKLINFFCKYYPRDYPEPEVACTVIKMGAKIDEIPVKMRKRENGVSSIGFWKSIYYMVKVSVSIIYIWLGGVKC